MRDVTATASRYSEQQFAQVMEAQITASEAQITLRASQPSSVQEAQYQAGLAAYNAGQATFTQQKECLKRQRCVFRLGCARRYRLAKS